MVLKNGKNHLPAVSKHFAGECKNLPTVSKHTPGKCEDLRAISKHIAGNLKLHPQNPLNA